MPGEGDGAGALTAGVGGLIWQSFADSKQMKCKLNNADRSKAVPSGLAAAALPSGVGAAWRVGSATYFFIFQMDWQAVHGAVMVHDLPVERHIAVSIPSDGPPR